MTKIKNKLKIIKRYEEDLWGFLLFKKKKSKVNKLIYFAQIDQFRKIDIRFLQVTTFATNSKRQFFRTLISKANSMTMRLRNYLVNLNQRQVKLLCTRTSHLYSLHKRNFSLLLESRVDSILIRTNLFTSIRTIRQWIMHGFIFLNLRRVWTSNQNLKIGDIISFPKEKKIILYKQFFFLYFKKKNIKRKGKYRSKFAKFSQSIPLYRPSYLEQNYKLFFFCLWRAPLWSEVPFLKRFKISHITGPSKNRY